MKKFFLFLLLTITMMVFVSNVKAQGKSDTPWKIINMEEVTKWGTGNTVYDDETCTATFNGSSNRWIDLPGLKGDLTEHTQLVFDILKSDCIMKVNIRYKDANGETQQVAAQTFYGSMAKPIKAKKQLKSDLTNKGKISSEVLKNVVSIRISMAKGATGSEEPWTIQFGKVTVF